jgi:hypothetical protein
VLPLAVVAARGRLLETLLLVLLDNAIPRDASQHWAWVRQRCRIVRICLPVLMLLLLLLLLLLRLVVD